MEIYHLNCGTMHAYGMPLDDGTGGFFRRGRGVVHCLLVDTGDGLALVDSGWGRRDYSDPSPMVRQFMRLIGSGGDPGEAAVRQIERLGYDPGDVKHIFITHMHLDHAGGLADFPAATVHLSALELDAYLQPRTLAERFAYRPEHRTHSPRWQAHTVQGGRWFGLGCTPPVRVGEAEFVMVPLEGHTRGHCAVALRMGDRWLLHCGDAYGYYRQADPVQPYRHPCGGLMETLVTVGFNMPRRQWAVLRELLRAHSDEIQAFCTHDAHEFDACQPGPGQL